VIPAKFDYVRPSSVEEAVSALQSAGEDAKILAGGQSLLPVLRLRIAAPSTVIDLGGIAELADRRGRPVRHGRRDGHPPRGHAQRPGELSTWS
jgi:CO/xanthine dehydrogenase FAD-binding subunit